MSLARAAPNDRGRPPHGVDRALAAWRPAADSKARTRHLAAATHVHAAPATETGRAGRRPIHERPRPHSSKHWTSLKRKSSKRLVLRAASSDGCAPVLRPRTSIRIVGGRSPASGFARQDFHAVVGSGPATSAPRLSNELSSKFMCICVDAPPQSSLPHMRGTKGVTFEESSHHHPQASSPHVSGLVAQNLG